MNKLLRKCIRCHAYNLDLKCPRCGSETTSPHPPKFSPDDKYLRYRMPERYVSQSERQTVSAETVQKTD